MIPRTARFYHPNAAERVAVLSVHPVTGRTSAFHLRVARGQKASNLSNVSTTGPYPESQLPERFAEAEQSLRQQGYFPGGVHALLTALQSSNSAVRARAAARLGWMRSREGMPALLAAMPNAVDDVCALIDALGAIGDAQAATVLRPQAARKLLSRRRSAAEALRNLGDAQGLAEVRQLALERLPTGVRQVVEAAHTNPAALATAILALDVQQQGLALDTIYELATPVSVAATLQVVRSLQLHRPHIWRYVKSIVKRAALRHDYATFGEIMHRIEVQARSTPGTTASVKSGYDGQQRQTPIFRRSTQFFMRRMAWRFLRMLAGHRPEAYPFAAAEAVIQYGPEDAQAPQGLSGAFAGCYLLNRIIWGNSKRLTLDDRRLRFRFRSSKHVQPPGGDFREEAFPELWDAQPRAFLRVLGAARLPEVHIFALGSFLKSPKYRDVLAAASIAELLGFLQAPYEPTTVLGLEELERRFDPNNPNWDLLQLLLIDQRAACRRLAERFVRLAAPVWTRDPERIIQFLASPPGELQALVVELAGAALVKDATLREALAPRILAILRAPETAEGLHEGYAQLAREVLRKELGALLTVADLAVMIFRGSPTAQGVAGELLRYRPEAIAELGLDRLCAMAQHDVVLVRSAVHGLLRSALALLQSDPAPLFVLVESDWADTRNLAFELLREIDLSPLGLNGFLGLLDSNRTDVQDLGKELTARHFTQLPSDELVYRLTQHPHPNMRRFALELAEKHLPKGDEPLAELQQFFRTCLFDLWPDRRVKRRVAEFLLQRGLQDPQQAELAASILADLARVQGRADFERALESLVRLKLAHPEVEAGINLWPGGEP